MTDNEIRGMAVEAIRQALTEHHTGSDNILLFGSRARGEEKPDSDWDFMVVTDRVLTRGEKTDIKMAVRRKMAERLVSVDLILKDRNTFRKQRENTGIITYYAARDGVAV